MRKGLLSTIYVLFFLTVGGAILTFNFQNEFAKSPERLKQGLREADIYSRLTHINAKDLEAAIATEERDPESEISADALQQLITKVSPATLQTTAESGMDLYYDAYINNKPTIAIDLTKLKAEVVANQPAEVATELNRAVPNQYNLKVREEKSAPVNFLTNKNIKFYGLGLLILLFVAGILLAEGFRGRVRTASAFFIIAGLEVIILWYVTTVLPVSSLGNLAETNISAYLLAIMQDLIKVFLVRFTELFKTQGFWLLGIGVVLLIISFFVPSSDSAKEASAPKENTEPAKQTK